VAEWERMTTCSVCLSWRRCAHLAALVSMPIASWALPEGLDFAVGPTYRFADVCDGCKLDADERMHSWAQGRTMEPYPLGELFLIEDVLDAEVLSI